jgi:hypothetical protein
MPPPSVRIPSYYYSNDNRNKPLPPLPLLPTNYKPPNKSPTKPPSKSSTKVSPSPTKSQALPSRSGPPPNRPLPQSLRTQGGLYHPNSIKPVSAVPKGKGVMKTSPEVKSQSASLVEPKMVWEKFKNGK